MPNSYLLIWNASGSDFDVDAFRARFPDVPLKDDDVWKKGSIHRGQMLSESGFRLTLGESDDQDGAVENSLRDLESWSAACAHLRESCISNVVDVGILWDVDETVTTSFRLEAAHIARLAALGTGWEISVYPCGSADDEDSPAGEG